MRNPFRFQHGGYRFFFGVYNWVTLISIRQFYAFWTQFFCKIYSIQCKKSPILANVTVVFRKRPVTRFYCADHNFSRMDNRKRPWAIYRSPLLTGYAVCLSLSHLSPKRPYRAFFLVQCNIEQFSGIYVLNTVSLLHVFVHLYAYVFTPKTLSKASASCIEKSQNVPSIYCSCSISRIYV